MNMYSTDGFTQSEVVYMPANYAFMQLHTLNNATSCVTHLTVLHSFVLFLTQSIIRLQTSWKTLHKSHVEQYFYQQSLTRTTFKISPICKHKRPIDTLQQTSKTHCWNKDPWSRWFVLTGMQIPILLPSNLHPIPPVSFTTFPKGKAYKKSIKADTIMISCRISFWRTSGGLYLRHKEDRSTKEQQQSQSHYNTPALFMKMYLAYWSKRFNASKVRQTHVEQWLQRPAGSAPGHTNVQYKAYGSYYSHLCWKGFGN